MGRVAKELNAVYVSRLSIPGMYFVGGAPGLALQVLPSGGRSWVLRVRVHGKRRDMGLGSFPSVSLALARQLARDARAKVQQGIDPIEERKEVKLKVLADRVKMKTFKESAELYIAAKQGTWKNSKSPQQWRSTLETYAYPTLGNLAIKDVELSHVLAVLEPIWRVKTETASRLRGRIESIIDWATVTGLRTGSNPARWRGRLDKLLPEAGKVKNVEHHPALPAKEMNAFWRRLKDHEGMGTLALKFAILTVARSGEVRNATWSEIDEDDRMWVIPAEKMKAKREHRVPLVDEAWDILQAMPRHEESDVIFHSEKGKPLSDATLSALLRRMKVKAVPHGFRSTFKDWATEYTNHQGELTEMALAHAVPDKVEAAYRRGDMLMKRFQLGRVNTNSNY